MTRLGERPLIRLKGLLGGRYIYTEAGERHLVHVTYDRGDCFTTFLDVEDEDEGLMVATEDLTGTFERR